MTTATRTRKPRTPRPQPQRTLRYFHGTPGLMELTINGVVQDYWLSEIGADWGRAFEVRKPLPEGTVYHVHLDAQAGDSCDCQGCVRWGHCKHLSAVKALVAAGRLPR